MSEQIFKKHWHIYICSWQWAIELRRIILRSSISRLYNTLRIKHIFCRIIHLLIKSTHYSVRYLLIFEVLVNITHVSCQYYDELSFRECVTSKPNIILCFLTIMLYKQVKLSTSYRFALLMEYIAERCCSMFLFQVQ